MRVPITHFGTPRIVRPLAFSADSSGNNLLIPGITGIVLIVFQYSFVCAGAVTVSWESSGGTVISGAQAYAANGGIERVWRDHGCFRTLKGEGLVLDLSGAVQVGGDLMYGEIEVG